MRNCILPKQWVWISLQNKQNTLFSLSHLHLEQKKKSNVISRLGKNVFVCLCLSVSKMSGPQLHPKSSKLSKYPVLKRFYPCPPTFLDSVFHNFNKCLANFNKHISIATNFCSFAFSSHLWGKFSISGEPRHLLFQYLQPGSLALIEKTDSPTTPSQPQLGGRDDGSQERACLQNLLRTHAYMLALVAHAWNPSTRKVGIGKSPRTAGQSVWPNWETQGQWEALS